MSLFVPRGNRWGFRVSNFGTNPTNPPGTSITPGASDAEGSYTSLIAAGNVTEDIWGIYVQVLNGFTSTAIKSHLLDIGYDPAGGSSYTTLISNIVCGAASGGASLAAQGHTFYFPIKIPSGSTIAGRVQGSNGTAGSVVIAIKAYGKPSEPAMVPCGSYAETVGTISGSQGVSFTPGNATDGTWASLGTTSKDLWWWNVAYQVSNGTITNENCYIDIGWGDGSNKHVIATKLHSGGTTETCGEASSPHILEGYALVPAGNTMYIRGRCSNAPDSGYNGVAVGIGG